MQPIPPELDLTLDDNERRGVQKYREFVQARRDEGVRRRHLAQVEQQYPDLDDASQHALADSMYRKSHGEKIRRWKTR